MELLKTVRSRSFLSEAVYMVLNIALAIAVTLVIIYTGSPALGILLVLLSKWRVFAVRPRYWWANFQSNLVDFIVSVSIVVHMAVLVDSPLGEPYRLMVIWLLAAIHIFWLLFVKPRSTRRMVALQAAIAVLFATSALFTVSFSWPVSAVTVFMWLIGYTAARHVLNSYDNEDHRVLMALVIGLIFAEIGWVAYHWAVAYSLPIFTTIQIPQVSIILTLVSFLMYKTYDSFYHHERVRTNDILLPLLLTISVVAILLAIFNRVGTAI